MLRKTILETTQMSHLSVEQTVKSGVFRRQHTVILTLSLLLVLAGLAVSAPRKVAERAGRGCSAPLWSSDSRFIAFTNIDLDTLYVVEPAESRKEQELYRVAHALGVGRRYVFVPGEERLAYREMVGAIGTHPDRIISTSFYSYDPSMLTSNMNKIIGPYRINNQIYYRESLSDPLISVTGDERTAGAYKKGGKLVVKNAQGNAVFTSDGQEEPEGFEVSPDGHWVAAVFAKDNDHAVRLIQISDGAIIELGRGRWPSWSGNSNRVVFVRDKEELKYAEMVVYDLQVGQSRSVMGVNQFWPDEPSLNGDGSKVAFVHDGEIFVTEVTGF